MRLFKVCKTKQDLAAYIVELCELSRVRNIEQLYHEGDLEKCSPFFEFECRHNRDRSLRMTEEEVTSFKYFQSIQDEYLRNKQEDWETLREAGEVAIIDLFGLDSGYNYSEDGEQLDPIINKDTIESQLSDFPYTFPLVVAGCLVRGWDRMSEFGFGYAEFVEQKAFE